MPSGRMLACTAGSVCAGDSMSHPSLATHAASALLTTPLCIVAIARTGSSTTCSGSGTGSTFFLVVAVFPGGGFGTGINTPYSGLADWLGARLQPWLDRFDSGIRFYRRWRSFNHVTNSHVVQSINAAPRIAMAMSFTGCPQLRHSDGFGHGVVLVRQRFEIGFVQEPARTEDRDTVDGSAP